MPCKVVRIRCHGAFTRYSCAREGCGQPEEPALGRLELSHAHCIVLEGRCGEAALLLLLLLSTCHMPTIKVVQVSRISPQAASVHALPKQTSLQRGLVVPTSAFASHVCLRVKLLSLTANGSVCHRGEVMGFR